MPFDGFTAAALQARLGIPKCHYLLRVTSTMDVLHELAEDGVPHGTVVLAEEQVKGRGSKGRAWTSPPDAGLWMSYLIRTKEQKPVPVISLRIGLAIADALDEYGIDSALKWPNDVLVDDLKVGGVLCEVRGSPGESWIAVGIGINVYGPTPTSLSDKASYLARTKPDITRVGLLESLTRRLKDLKTEPLLSPIEVTRFTQRDWLLGRRIRLPLVGLAEGIGRDGALLVGGTQGTHKLYGGNVEIE